MRDITTANLDAEFYTNNRARLRQLFKGTAPIVIAANGKLQKGTSDHFALYQDGSFLYLTGINKPDIILVIDKDKEYLILPEQSDSSDAFFGAHDQAELTAKSGITEILDNKTGWKKLSIRLKKAKHYATLAPAPVFVEHYNFYTNPARAELLASIKKINANIEPLDLRQHLAVMRMVKQPAEIAAIQAAIDISIASFKEVKRKLAKLTNEYEVEALLSYGFRRRGAASHAYTPVVASGQATCTMHYDENNQPLVTGQLLLIDAGASVSRYAADITRTFVIGKAPSKRQRQVFEAVMEVRQFALDRLKPGVTILENERATEQFMGEKLRALGLIRNVEHDEIRKYFPHATSHYLGLDVHDSGDYERPLEPGVVLTVEPGIYIPDENIGIRLEDDVLITETGNTVLSAKLPHDL